MGSIGKGLLVALIALRVVNFDMGKKPDSVKTFIPDGRIVTAVRIGILPFNNLSDDRSADAKIMQPLITYMLTTGKFTVVDPLVLEQAFIKHKVRSIAEIDPDTAKKLIEELNMKHILVGTITGFKDARVGSDSYPVISLSARLLNIEDMSVAWASSITRTGKDKAKIFDIGRVDTLDSLVAEVVNEMASSMGKHIDRIIPKVEAKAPEGEAGAAVPAEGTVVPAGEAPKQPAKPRTPRLADGAELAEADAKALLPELPGYVRGGVIYEGGKFNPVTLTKYEKDGALFLVELTDYKEKAKSESFLKLSHPSLSPQDMEGFAVYKSSSKFGLLVMEAHIGRLVLKVSGNSALESGLQQLAMELSKKLAE